MTLTAKDEIAFVEVMKDPAVRADPYPLYEELRRRGRLVPTDFGARLVTSHEDVLTVLRDPRFSSSNRHQPGYADFRTLVNDIGLGDLFAMYERLLLFADAPDHTRLRKIVGRAFTRTAVESMHKLIAGTVREHLDAADAAGGIDVVEDLALPLPVRVISEMLGVPESDQAHLRVWTAEAVKLLDPDDDIEGLLAAAVSVREMRGYFDQLVSERRSRLGTDLLSAMILAEAEGDRFSHDELLDMMILLFGGGHETTANLISGGMLSLLRHPDQLRALAADPALMATGLDEIARYVTPVQFVNRTTTTAVELAGESLSAGTELIALIGSANRDPRVFDGPDVLDLGRIKNNHLAFGTGAHACLGALLGRAEAQVAISQLVRRHPLVVGDLDDLEWRPSRAIRGPARLELSW